MKFAIVGSRGFPSSYGGYETLVRYLAPHMARNGHDVTVYCRERRDGRRRWLHDGVHCQATRGLHTESMSTLSHGFTSTVTAMFSNFDAVLVLNIANGVWMPLLKASGTPLAVNTDGIEWERGKWSRLGRAAFRAGALMTARSADALVCDSRAIGRIWRDRYSRESVFIPYGAEVLDQRDPPPLRKLGLDQRPYLLVVARLVPENNVEVTLDALRHLGDDAPFAVVVGSASSATPIEGRLESLQSSGRAMWLGHVNDQELLSQLWMNCSVYVHGHSVGGTNPALLQALGAGAPTLALDTSFNAEVLPFRDQRFSRDVVELAGMIKAVAGSRARQIALRTRGQAIIREAYDWDVVCQTYTKLLVALAGGCSD